MSLNLYTRHSWKGASVRFRYLRDIARAKGWNLDVENAGKPVKPVQARLREIATADGQ